MVKYRTMESEDYSAVIALWSATEAMLLRDADSEQSINQYLKRNAGLSFVALNQQEIIGAILVGTDGHRGYVQHLAVKDGNRGKGVGRQLLQCSIDSLALEGIAKTHLFVANDNLKAQKFYQSLEWFPCSEVTMYSYNSSNNKNV